MSKNKELVAAATNLEEINLSSSALAMLANYDVKNFEGVELDVAENKELFSNDIIVPKIWLMQDMSELAKNKSRKDVESGDYIDSQSEEVLLKVDDENGFIPFVVLKTFKRWQTFQTTENGKFLERKKFVSSALMTLDNAEWDYEFTDNGETYSRRQVISAYVLKGDDAQKGIIKPYILDFSATSKEGGRSMISDIKVLNSKGLPAFVGWFKLGVKQGTNDKGDDFYMKTVKFGGLLPETMMPFLKEAYVDIKTLIKANVIEIDDRDVKEEAKQTVIKDSGNVVDQASNNDEAGI